MATDSRRAAKIEIGLDHTDLDRDIASARRKMRTWGRDMKRNKFGGSDGNTRAAPKAKRGMGVRGAVLGGVAALGVVGFLADSAQGALDLQRQLDRLQVSGEMSAGSIASFRDELRRVSRDTGVGESELAGAAQQMITITGNADMARQSMQLMADVMKATGSNGEGVAAVMSSLSDNLKVDPKDFRAAFDMILYQAHAGSIEVEDLTRHIGELAGIYQSFQGGSGLSGNAEVGALFQAIRKGGLGNADKAKTAMEALLNELGQSQKKLKKYGIKVFAKDENGNVYKRNAIDILDEIYKHDKLGADERLRNQVLTNTEAQKGYNAYAQQRAVLYDLLDTEKARGQTAKDAAAFQATTTGKIEKSMNALKLGMADLFTPERIKGFVDGLTGLLEVASGIADVFRGIGEMIDTVTENPVFQGISWFAGEMAGGSLYRAQERAVNDKLAPQVAAKQAMQGMILPGAAGDVQLAANYGLSRDEVNAELAREMLAEHAKMRATIAQALADGLARQPVNVNLDGTKVRDKIDNSPRKMPRGRM